MAQIPMFMLRREVPRINTSEVVSWLKQKPILKSTSLVSEETQIKANGFT